MKRKFADRPNWGRILEKDYKHIVHRDDAFHGYISYLSLIKVKEPLVVKYDSEEVCIVDDGFVWMMHFPMGLNYSITTTIDNNGNIIQWYIDIINNQGFTDDGIPYIDDLYLDLVVLPNGSMYVLDEDELEEALVDNKITNQEYDKAKQTLQELVQSIRNNSNLIIREGSKHFEMMN